MDMRKMMKQAQKMQLELSRAQEEIKEMEFEASSGGGMVSVVAGGDMTIKRIEIKPEVIDPDDPDMLSDMILVAVNDALRSVNEASSQRLNSVTGGMKIPGLS